ncbi:MAG: integral rane sensor signal transduction histidine kinase [candidate division NC10 bacterium]|nr:integral rane sensor signal transduction histidine kinase [candidate division NC10 bacterium]
MPVDPLEGRNHRRYPPLLYSLKTRFVAALILLVGVVLGLSTWWNLTLHTGHMIQATEEKVQALADAIDGGIQVAMREGHTTEVQRILEAMARDPDIEHIVILDDGGQIRQASKPALVGRTVDPDRLSRYLAQADSAVTGRYESGKLIQSVVKKIRNRAECRTCHGATAATLGTLQLDMSFRQTQRDIATMKRAALWTVVLTGLVMAGGGGFLMTRLVDRRVTRLSHAMARVEAGDLSVPPIPGGPDELGRLTESFNTMVDRLRAARDEIEVYHRQRLDRAERLATLGQVAASLAHEIRNPLAGIAGAVGVMADELPDTDPRKEIMAEILSQVRRLTKTVQDLLAFARPAAPTFASCDLHQVLDRVLLLLAEDPVAKRMRLVRNYGFDVPRLEADDKQLGQVFLNLLLNAAQAVHGEGQVTITTRLNHAGGADGEPSASDGGQTVEVSVTDTGPGIPPGILPELFTPFFTTKPRGTGLGLAISRRIIEDHGGWIRAESPPGQGATFRIGLPVAATRRDGGDV